MYFSITVSVLPPPLVWPNRTRARWHHRTPASGHRPLHSPPPAGTRPPERRGNSARAVSAAAHLAPARAVRVALTCYRLGRLQWLLRAADKWELDLEYSSDFCSLREGEGRSIGSCGVVVWGIRTDIALRSPLQYDGTLGLDRPRIRGPPSERRSSSTKTALTSRTRRRCQSSGVPPITSSNFLQPNGQ